MERFAELNVYSIEVFMEYFHVVLARSVLVKLKRVAYIHGKPFTVLLKTVKVFSPVFFHLYGIYMY